MKVLIYETEHFGSLMRWFFVLFSEGSSSLLTLSWFGVLNLVSSLEQRDITFDFSVTFTTTNIGWRYSKTVLISLVKCRRNEDPWDSLHNLHDSMKWQTTNCKRLEDCIDTLDILTDGDRNQLQDKWWNKGRKNRCCLAWLSFEKTMTVLDGDRISSPRRLFQWNDEVMISRRITQD